MLLATAGIACQLLLLNTTLYGMPNQATIAFTTSTNAAPNSMLMCFNSTAVQLTPDSFSVIALSEGGDLFQGPTSNFTIAPIWNATPFFLPGSSGIGLDAAQYGSLRHITGTDPFYSGSYFNQRLDDFCQDWKNQDITGLVTYPGPASTSIPTSSASQTSNCELLSGAWRAGTLYQLTFTFTNPLPSALPAAQVVPAIWVAPVTATVTNFTLSNGDALQEASFSVRSNKYGALCSMRPAVAEALGTLWDACETLRTLGVNTTTLDSVEEGCVTLLQGLAVNNTGFPFTSPPVQTYTVDSWPDPPCSPGQARSSRYGGLCVNCGSGALVGNTCVCPAGVAPALLGSEWCPQQPGSDGTSASTQTLASSLCTTFLNVQARWQNGTLTAKSVARIALKAFTVAAQSVIDHTAWTEANATFYLNYVFDNRRPASPTRQYGIQPSCSKCNGGPTFKNVFNDNLPDKVFDYQFDAMNALRLIGYVLSTNLGMPCVGLWDPRNSMEWKYGFYQDILCQPLPTTPVVSTS